MDPKKFPLYTLDIIELLNDETGVELVSFVEEPALQMNWLMFSKEKKHSFEIESEDKRIVTGPIMLADTPIYRYSEDIGEYYVKFERETVGKMINKFAKKKNTDKVNQEHLTPIEGVYMIHSWVVDSKLGMKAPKAFGKVPDGSWFGSYFIEDKQYWKEFIKTGKVKGFSIEGMFLQEYEKAITTLLSKEKIKKEVEELLFSDIKKEDKQTKIVELLKKL